MRESLPILIGVAVGILSGVLAADISWLPPEWLALPGDLFVRSLKMVVLPLVVSSIATGIRSLGQSARQSRTQLFRWTLFFYLGSSLIAIVTGLALVNLIGPGEGLALRLPADITLDTSQVNLISFIKSIIPANLVAALSEGDMLAIIVGTAVFTFASLGLKPDMQRSIDEFLDALQALSFKVTAWILTVAPVGVASLLAGSIAAQGTGWLHSLLGYTAVVCLGLILHGFVTLPLLAITLGQVQPARWFKTVRHPLVFAFTTASSAATLPLSLRAMASPDIPQTVPRFVLPIGATLNMDGTALYECVAVLFIAQAYGIDLTVAQQALVVLTSMAVSIGAAGIPMAGLVMMTIILDTVGLPAEAIGLILAVDRLLDMGRTAINVTSDLTGSMILAHRWKA